MFPKELVVEAYLLKLMKKGEMRIDSVKDTVTIFGLKQKLFFNLQVITVFFLEMI